MQKSLKEHEPLLMGDSVKNFIAIDQNNRLFSLDETLKNGPVVLLFYRGHWCPVCNKHLRQLEENLHLIYDKGASVVAVSPETAPFLRMTVSKTSASFILLHDEGYKISNAFGVTFLPDNKSLDVYNQKLNANLESAHSDDSMRLPIPATFILSKAGKITWRHVNPDYKVRASTEEILTALDDLQK